MSKPANSNPVSTQPAIRLIATDLDGTLLNDEKQIDSSFWEVYERLSRQGVLFIAASGRQYYNLEQQFERVKDSIVFLAENGTFVRHQGKDLFINNLDPEDARYFIRKARGVEQADVILCGKNAAYIESRHKPFVEDARRYYHRLEIVEDLTLVEDKVLKVTLWDHRNAETFAYPHFKFYENDFKIAVAGDAWLDITGKTASKGTAIDRIQQLFDISPQETLVFGDYLNDLDMMGAGWHSYAMKNAHPRILKVSRFVTRYDNNNNGVVETIKTLFGL